MAIQRTKKGQAAYTLDNEINMIEYRLESAIVIAEDLLDYFSQRPDLLDDRKEQATVIIDYGRNAKKMHAVFHFISDAMDKIRALLEEIEIQVESEAEQ